MQAFAGKLIRYVLGVELSWRQKNLKALLLE